MVLNGFEWWSESEEALDEELQFKLSTWASLTAVVLKFPTDKTYLFDLHLYTEADGGDEPFATLTVRPQKDRLRCYVRYSAVATDRTQDSVTLASSSRAS